MLHLDAVSKSYGPRTRPIHALRPTTLTVSPGVWALVGPNGAGKSTLIGLALGFLRPTTGAVAIDHVSPRRYRRRHGVAYLPERFRLPPEWPVRAALRAFARLEGHAGDHAAARADAAIERLGLEAHADRPAGELSRGLHQRVGLAQALLADRDLVVLDEPTEGLDPIWRVRFRDLVAGFRAAGRTVLLASHDLGEVERLADRVVLLDDGAVVDVMDLAVAPAAATRYRLDVTAPDDVLALAFPDARREGGPAGGAGDAAGPVLVAVADARELSHRLAALIEAGGVVRSVVPTGDGLEERVRRTLEGGGQEVTE